MDEIYFRAAVKGDIPQMVELMNSQYARKKDENYFIWQYFKSVFPSISICAFLNDSLIGMFGLQKRLLTNNSKIGNTLDAVIAPEFRGKGLFSKLYEKVVNYFDDIDILCALANLNGKNVFVGLGWENISSIDKIELLQENFSLIEYGSNDTLSFEHEQSNETIKFYSNSSIRKWRFNDHPDYQYNFVMIDENNFAITKVFIDPVTKIKFGDIVDFECNTNKIETLKTIFCKAIKELQKQKVESITTWALPHTQLFKVLQTLDFKSIAQERYFCIKILNQNINMLKKVSNWHLVQADTEIF